MSFGTRWSRLGNPPWVGRRAGGSPGALTDIPTWLRFDFTYLDFQLPALNYSRLLYALPAGGQISGAKLKHTELFTGPGITSVQASAGLGTFGSAFNDDNNGRFTLFALASGIGFNTNSLEIKNTVLAGFETVTWGANTLVIEVEAGVSTVAQVLAAVPTGIPWAILANNTPGTVDALVATATSLLPGYVPGTDGNLERIISLFDVMQPVGDSVGITVNIMDWLNQNAATDLEVQLAVTGANASVLTQGALSVWLLLSKAV